MAEANLSEKTLELSSIQHRVTTIKNIQEVAEKIALQIQVKLDETKVKLAEASSVVSAQDKKLVDLKDTMINSKQVVYNTSFKEDENSAGPVIFQT